MDPELDNPAAIFAALERGESLPSRWYTDPAITTREVDQSLARAGTTSGRAAS